MQAGADVYVEKPISVDVVEGRSMVAAARMPDAFDGLLIGYPGFNLPRAALQHVRPVELWASAAATGTAAHRARARQERACRAAASARPVALGRRAAPAPRVAMGHALPAAALGNLAARERLAAGVRPAAEAHVSPAEALGSLAAQERLAAGVRTAAQPSATRAGG